MKKLEKYGESVKVKTKQMVIDYTNKTGQKIGWFYDQAVKEKIDRELKLKK